MRGAASIGVATAAATRSSRPDVCRFLQALDADGHLVAPVERPDVVNRCAALDDAVPQSLRQQELVCLTAGHVDCPRFVRGAALVTEATEVRVRGGSMVTPAVIGSLMVLVVAFAASIMFVAARGGIELRSAAGPTPTGAQVAIASVAPGPSASAAPTVIPTATPSPTPVTTPSPTPTATPSPTATPEPTPEPTPRSDRYDLLEPCPDQPDCWIYTVRRGDNLVSIANYFGIPRRTVYALNPWAREQGLRAGRKLILPPPTR
jgi:hypothetical protein